MNNSLQNFQYKDSENTNITWLNFRKIEYMTYADLFDLIINQYSNNIDQYKNSKYFNAMEKRIWVPDYNKARDKKKSLEKILQSIPEALFDIHRETLIPRTINHYSNQDDLFRCICDKFSITQEEINIAKIKIQKSHEEIQANKEILEIKQYESKVKKQVTKITQDQSIYELIQDNSSGIWWSDWIMQSKIRWNISWLNSQEYINRSIELIFINDSEYVYKNTQAWINGSYLISPEFIDLIILLYKSLTDWLGFINQDEIDNYLKNKNITLSEYLLQNYTRSKDLIEKKESNVLWIKKIFYTLKLI